MKLLSQITLLFFITNTTANIYSQEGGLQQNLSSVQDAVNNQNKKLSLDFIPQFHNYSSYIPKQIKDILSKADLTNIQVDYDPTASIGALSASTKLGDTDAVIRIIVGKSLSTGTTFQAQFQQNLQNYQNKLKSVYTAIPQNPEWSKGLTIAASSGATNQEKQNLINEALKAKAATPQEGETTPAQPAEAAKQSWVSKQLAGFQAGILFILPKGFKFASISNDLKFLDYIDFEEVILGIGSEFSDPIYGPIPQGFSLVAKVNSNIEPFKTIASLLNKIPGPAKVGINQPFTLRGGITPSLGGSSFGFGLPGQIAFKLSDKTIAETDQLSISLMLLPLPEGTMGVGGLSVGLSGGLTVYLNKVDSRLNPLNFEMAFAVDSSSEASVTGIMDGLLNLKAIGLPLEFGNITLTVGINPANIETLGLAELGMMGELDFGPTNDEASIKAAIDAKLSGQNTNILVYGDLEPKGEKKDALTLKDLINLTTSAFNELGAHIGSFESKIPNLGINKATFYFSPQNTIFANKLWKAGAKIDLQLDILGAQALLEADISSSGFEATGFLSEVELGPLKITGAGGSKKCSAYDTCLKSCDSTTTGQSIDITDPHAPKDATKAFELTEKNVPQALKDWTDYSKLKGPIVNIRFKPPTNIGMFISAEIDLDAGKLGTFKTDACLDMSLKGVSAHFEVQIFNILDTVFTLNAQDFIKPKEWYVCAKMQQSALTLLEQEVAKFVKAAKKEVSEQIQNAQDQVASAEKAYTNAFNQAQSGINSAKEKVDSLKDKLDAAKNKCAGHGGDSGQKYPYQKPHQFNPEYAQPQYVFLGDLTVYGSESYTTTINNKTISLAPNTKHPLLNDFVTVPPPPKNDPFHLGGLAVVTAVSKYMQNTNNPLIVKNGESIFFKLTPKKRSLEPINILSSNTNNIITTYVWRNQPKPTGYKIIFDTQKFAEYTTQTYWYTTLPKGIVSGFAFGLAINGDNLDITDPKNTSLAINRMFNINILQQVMSPNINLLDISLFPKIAEKNLKTPMSYTDLFFGPEKIIQVVPLNKNDFTMLTIKGR